MYKKVKRKGITLIELLIATILIGIGVGASSTILISGNHLLKRAKNEAMAMTIAIAQKERLLAKSYGGLEVGDKDTVVEYSGTEDIFYWEALVTELVTTSEPDSGITKSIPFKKIVITVTYPDEGISGNATNKWKKIVLANLIPYPFLHFEKALMDVSCSTAGCTVPFGSDFTNAAQVGDLTVTFNYPVEKDIHVFYNIAINIDTNLDVFAGTESIFTKCFLDGVEVGEKTGTPILSQPLISGDTSAHASADTIHTVNVRWYKDTASGNISITRANLMLLAFEPPN